jgi:hypothetical protein
MKKYVIITLSIIIINGCKSGCQEVREYCLSLDYYFMITAKSKDRFIEFKGLDKNNNHVEFKEFENWDIFGAVELGDTLVKKIGETEIILIKKDTTMLFPLICGGRIIDKYGKMW